VANERRIQAHKEALARRITEEGHPTGNCGRCADIWCNFNVTPEERLPNTDNLEGVDIRDDSCKDSHRDWQIPATLT
jgi:hypothetical protein